jgi:6-phosphogluconolactonase
VDVEIVSGPDDRLAARAAVWMAERAWEAVMARGVAHVAVSGGQTPAAMFAALAGLPVPWEAVHVWQVDERVAPDGDPDRNATALTATLLSRVPAAAHLMAVTATDLAGAAAAYAAELHAACDGCLDVVHLGIGDDGHTASWPPGDPVADISDADVALSGEYQGRVRMTLTVPAVNRSRHRMFLVQGESKARALRQLVDADVSIPASHVRRSDCVVLCDATAASMLG